MPGVGEVVRQRDPQLAGGHVGHAPGAVDGFIAWTTGNEDFHTDCRLADTARRETSACSCWARFLRLGEMVAMTVKCTVAETPSLRRRLSRCGTSVMSRQ